MSALVFKIVEEYNCPKYKTGEEIFISGQLLQFPDENSICLKLYKDIKDFLIDPKEEEDADNASDTKDVFLNCFGCTGMIRLTYCNDSECITENAQDTASGIQPSQTIEKPVVQHKKEVETKVGPESLEHKKRKRFIITEKEVVVKEDGKIVRTEKQQKKEIKQRPQKPEEQALILTSKGIKINRKGALAKERELQPKRTKQIDGKKEQSSGKNGQIVGEKEQTAGINELIGGGKEQIAHEAFAINRKVIIAISSVLCIAGIVIFGVFISDRKIEHENVSVLKPPAVVHVEKRSENRLETQLEFAEEKQAEANDEQFLSGLQIDEIKPEPEEISLQPIKIDKKHPEPVLTEKAESTLYVKEKKSKPPPVKAKKEKLQPVKQSKPKFEKSKKVQTRIANAGHNKQRSQKENSARTKLKAIETLKPEPKPVKEIRLAAIPKNEKPYVVKLKPKTITTFVTHSEKKHGKNSIGMKFIYIPPGTFMMGTHPVAPIRDEDEKYHQVSLTKGYFIQTTEVTQAQWKKIMGDESAFFPFRPFFKKCGNNCPMENISWADTQEFIRKLNRKEKTVKYRLPSEAEWEYACRAGSSTSYCYGQETVGLEEYAWYQENSNAGSHPVGQKKPNKWGLYDMHGNLWEWCQDWNGEYPTNAVTDPKGPSKGTLRVCRGGSWRNYSGGVRSAYRDYVSPSRGDSFIGFRIVRQP